MYNTLSSHWDVASLIFYLCLGMVGMISVSKVKCRENSQGYLQKMGSREYVAWFLIWVLFSVFRYVSKGIGGSDAQTYVKYFQECLDPYLNTNYATHLDFGYQLLCKVIRLFTADYHVLFLVVYGFITLSYIAFVNEFGMTGISYIPAILMFLDYWYSFNTIRTSITIGCILLAVVFFERKRVIPAVLLLIYSITVQKAALFYVCFIPFYILNKKEKFKWWHGLIWVALTTCAAYWAQGILANTDFGTYLNGAYVYYAKRSYSTSLWDNYWKISFGQLLLFVAMVVMRKRLGRDPILNQKGNRGRYELIKLMCIYDFMMIPVCYILGIWRGAEYFYLPRLIIWGMIIRSLSRILENKSRKIYYLFSFIAVVSWMIFRMYNTWEDARLMPYIFAPLYELFH